MQKIEDGKQFIDYLPVNTSLFLCCGAIQTPNNNQIEHQPLHQDSSVEEEFEEVKRSRTLRMTTTKLGSRWIRRNTNNGAGNEQIGCLRKTFLIAIGIPQKRVMDDIGPFRNREAKNAYARKFSMIKLMPCV